MARQFGHTWWGSAWLDALETRALLDPNRLPRGRTYARQGRVGALEVEPGLVSALVTGTELYRSSLGVRRLSDGQWNDLFDLIVARASHAAALLTGELPTGLVDEALDAGIDLLPGAGDLGIDCTCPDWAEPCKHVAAICYLIADLLDDDPFSLLLLRGRGRDEVLGEVRRRRAIAAGGDPAARHEVDDRPDPGIAAAAAYRRARGALPRPRPVPRAPGRPPVYAVAPPADSGVTAADLHALVADAAARAVGLLQGTGDSGLDLDRSADLARRAAAALTGGRPAVEALAERVGPSAEVLEARARAWHHGGSAALAVLDERWEPGAHAMAAGRAALGDGARVRANVVSRGKHQLRLDRTGRWWPLAADDELGWVITGPGVSDPEEAVGGPGQMEAGLGT